MNNKILAEQTNNSSAEKSWNPFISTKRDIERTDELASKNAVLAGTLSFVFVPAGLIYLNRGVNSLKILGYVLAASFMFGLVTKAEGNSKDIGNLLGLIGTGAITAEQVMAVNKARQRSQGKYLSVSSSVPTYSFDKNEKDLTSSGINQEAVKYLKQLKEKYEANEISEEEFKMQKQMFLESL
jgi:hypothetical protein